MNSKKLILKIEKYLWVFIKSVFNKDRNQYGYNIFLEKGSYQVADK